MGRWAVRAGLAAQVWAAGEDACRPSLEGPLSAFDFGDAMLSLIFRLLLCSLHAAPCPDLLSLKATPLVLSPFLSLP